MSQEKDDVKIDAIRRDIDEADENIVKAIDQRLQAVKRVAQVKRLQGLPVYDTGKLKEISHHFSFQLASTEGASFGFESGI